MGESEEKAIHRTSFVERLTTLPKILKMRLFFQAYSLAVFLVLTVNGDKLSKSCAKPYDRMMVCNLMCNLLQDSDANDAIKMLQTKLESLIAVVNKPSPTLLPGKLISTVSFWIVFIFKNLKICSASEREKQGRAVIHEAAFRSCVSHFSCLLPNEENEEALVVV